MVKSGKRAAVGSFPARVLGGLLLVVLLGATGTTHLFASELPEAENKGLEPGVVAMVNGDAILVADVERTLSARVPKVTGHGVLSDERIRFHRDEIIREMVVRRLMVQSAIQAGVEVTEAEIDAQEKALRARFSSDDDYHKAVAKQGLDKDLIRSGLRDYLLGEKRAAQVMDQVGKPSDEQLRTYYQNHLEKFVIPSQATISYLMLRVDPSAPKDVWERAKQRLAELKARIDKGETFADIRAEVVDGETFTAIDLGRVHEGQTGVAEIDKVAFQMAAQSVSDPVWTLYGYALVHVTEKLPGRQMKFEELNRSLFEKEWIEARRTDARNQWIAHLVGEAELIFSE